MGNWDMHFAPLHQSAFVAAGPTQFVAMSGDRTAIGRVRDSEELAGHDCEKIDAIYRNCPRHQRSCAALAAMAVL